MRHSIPAGARVVLLDGAIASVPLTLSQIGLPFVWRSGPASRAIGDISYRTESHAYRGVGLRPLSPVHIRGRRSDGDIEISWIRRTRIDGDSWQAVEVPLGEVAERYEIDIISEGAVVRTISAPGPTALYAVAEQVADFGAPQPSVTVRVQQISAVVGRGTPREAVI